MLRPALALIVMILTVVVKITVKADMVTLVVMFRPRMVSLMQAQLSLAVRIKKQRDT